jgi:hypothetical protein
MLKSDSAVLHGKTTGEQEAFHKATAGKPTANAGFR